MFSYYDDTFISVSDCQVDIYLIYLLTTYKYCISICVIKEIMLQNLVFSILITVIISHFNSTGKYNKYSLM